MEKQNLYLILIVGIVGVVAIIAMIIGVQPNTTFQTTPQDITGQAYLSVTETQTVPAEVIECTDSNDNTDDGCVHGLYARCGDGYLYIGVEQCEVTTLQGQSCEGFGYTGGTLKCTDCVFDTSGCFN